MIVLSKIFELRSKSAVARKCPTSWSLLSPYRIYYFLKYEEFTNPVVKAYMKYFATRNADSRETETINDQVAFYKADTLIRNKYMTYEFDLHESKEEGKAEAKLEMVDAMIANDIPIEKIAVISGFSQEEIEKRRAERKK